MTNLPLKSYFSSNNSLQPFSSSSERAGELPVPACTGRRASGDPGPLSRGPEHRGAGGPCALGPAALQGAAGVPDQPRGGGDG